jgi:AcrR family transcriptional regulator
LPARTPNIFEIPTTASPLTTVNDVKRPTAEQRRGDILDAAAQVVIERGFAGTRIADVAQKLDISTSLIHYHFESKDHLFAETFERAANGDLVRLADEVQKVDSALAKLDTIFRLYSPQSAEPGWMLWIDGWGEALRIPALKKLSQDLDLRWKQFLQDIISFGITTNEWTCSDIHGTSWRLAALLDGLAVQMTVHEGVLSHEEVLHFVRIAACAELSLSKDAFISLP